MVGFSFFLLVHMVDGVGIKRRLADTQDDGVTTGGASSSSCAGPEVPRGGVRQRLVQSDVSEASGSNGDLVSSLKKMVQLGS